MKRFAIAAFYFSALLTTCYSQQLRKALTVADFKKFNDLMPQVKVIFRADSAATRYLNLFDGNFDIGGKVQPDKYLIECNLYYKKGRTFDVRSQGQTFKKLLNKEGVGYMIDQMVISIVLPETNIFYYIYYL